MWRLCQSIGSCQRTSHSRRRRLNFCLFCIRTGYTLCIGRIQLPDPSVSPCRESFCKWGPNSHAQDYRWSPTRQGLRGHAFTFHQQRWCTRRRQFAFTIQAVPFWNELPAQIVNAPSVKSFKALPDARWQSLFPEVPIKPTNSTSAHIDPRKNPHPNDPSHKPTPLPGRLY